MLRFHSCDHLQTLLPGSQILSGQTRHQIHIQIGKSRFSRHVKTFLKLCPGMNPSQQFQFRIVCRLTAKTQPVDSRSVISCKIDCCQRSRIGFHRDLCIFFQTICVPYHLHQFLHPVPRKKRGRTTANINRYNFIFFCLRSNRRKFPQHGIQIYPPALLIGRSG